MDSTIAYEKHVGEFLRGRDESSVGSKVVEKWAHTLPKGAEVIEIACGGGYPITKTLTEVGLKLWTVDSSETLIKSKLYRFIIGNESNKQVYLPTKADTYAQSERRGIKCMATKVLKILFSITAFSASVYSINAFGSGFWSILFIGIAIIVLLSAFIDRVHSLSVVIVRISGVLATLALLLLMLAATVGGSFHLSESNEIFAVMLLILSFFGLSAFFWSIKSNEHA